MMNSFLPPLHNLWTLKVVDSFLGVNWNNLRSTSTENSLKFHKLPLTLFVKTFLHNLAQLLAVRSIIVDIYVKKLVKRGEEKESKS